MSKDDRPGNSRSDPNPRTYDAEWSDRPSTGIALAAGAVTGRDPRGGPALDDYIDTDALDDLLSGDTPRRGGPIRVSFEYDGLEISVDSDGGIVIRPDAEE